MNSTNGGKSRQGRGEGRPTVADVARKAGVSPMTVSRVVNAEGNVLAKTREKVQAAIAALGYVPNSAARTLAAGQGCRVVLLHSNPSSSYLSEFLKGSLAEAGPNNVQLQVEQVDGALRPRALVTKLVAQRVDGVLLPPPLSDRTDLLNALGKQGIESAQIATGKPASFAHAVTIDDRAGARAMTQHLLESGHRRIGFVIGNVNQTASALRREGFLEACAEAGVKVKPGWVVQGDFTYRSGLLAAEQLLRGHERPTAIFASNDDMAAGAVAVAHRAGLDVPSDLSICGFDDTPLATTLWPELTTVRQPVAQMAGLALSLLAEAIRSRGRGQPPRVVQHQLPFELVHRESVAAPPAQLRKGRWSRR